MFENDKGSRKSAVNGCTCVLCIQNKGVQKDAHVRRRIHVFKRMHMCSVYREYMCSYTEHMCSYTEYVCTQGCTCVQKNVFCVSFDF